MVERLQHHHQPVRLQNRGRLSQALDDMRCLVVGVESQIDMPRNDRHPRRIHSTRDVHGLSDLSEKLRSLVRIAPRQIRFCPVDRMSDEDTHAHIEAGHFRRDALLLDYGAALHTVVFQ